MNAPDKNLALAHYSAMAMAASRMVSGGAAAMRAEPRDPEGYFEKADSSPAQSTGTLHPVFVSILNAAAVRPKGYAWGARSNVEPPDEAEEGEEEDDDGDLTRCECVTGCEPQDRDGDEEPDATERERWADAACDRYERDMDARASQ